MSWYYALDGKQAGPVSNEEFQALAQRGIIQGDTLVWQEGMPNWQPYRQVMPAVAAAAGVPPAPPMPPLMSAPASGPSASPGSFPTGTAAGPGEVVCTECQGVFRQDNAIQYGTVWVCAGCKPRFVQRLREGTAVTTPLQGMRYAGFWIRFAARFIDGLIAGAIVGIPLMLLMFSTGILTGRPNQSQLVAIQVFGQLAGILFEVAYQWFFLGRFGATPGKMAVGIKVVTADGLPITNMKAFGRAWADRLSSLTCGIGYIIAGFDEEKRALHDHICSTRVIYK
jgi:uncharacterized RDD family membrane protein YckC